MALNRELQAIANRYAQALLDNAIESESLDFVTKDVLTLQKVLNSNATLLQTIKSPALSVADAMAVWGAILDKLNISGAVKGLILVLCENRRHFALDLVLTTYQDLLDAHNGVIVADVISASELSADNKQQIEQAVGKVVGSGVRISYAVKPALIGGLVVKIGSKLLDASVQTKLDKLKLETKGA